jgi:RHS repeat-associated protein
VANVYDFENHLIQQGGVSIVYDGDGNRAAKTVAGVKTAYIFDDRNPTGYVQVLAEVQGGSITRSYVYGLELIEQDRVSGTQQATSYNVYDGHGSVRALTDTTGTVTDTYDYDAFGNIIHSTGTTPNVYLYSAEQFDPDLHLYYNRARYLNVSIGRFLTMDTFDGVSYDPQTLHKYLYTSADPVNSIDPSGHDELGEFAVAEAGNNTVRSISLPLVRNILSSIYINAVNLPSILGTIANYVALGATGVELAARVTQLAANALSAQGPYSRGYFPKGNQVGANAGQNLDRYFPGIDDVVPVENNQYDVTQIKSTITIRDQQAFTQFVRAAATKLQAIGPDDELSGRSAAGKDFSLFGRQIRLRALLIFVPDRPINYNALAIIEQIEEETQEVIRVVPLPNLPQD